MKLDSLFFRRDAAPARRGGRQEPRFGGSFRPNYALETREIPDDIEEFDYAPSGRLNPRRMSPRQMADWAHEMYLCRMLTWEEYCMAGFPAELHPQYNRTVGALTGQLAQPDTARDMIRVWEERLSFALRYNDPEDSEVKRTEKLLSLLRTL